MNEIENVIPDEEPEAAPVVYMVIANLEYSEDNQIERTAGCGSEKAIIGIASDENLALQMIAEDHFETVSSVKLNPLRNPLSFDEESGKYLVELRGITEDETHWTNAVTWYVEIVPLNVLLEDFKL